MAMEFRSTVTAVLQRLGQPVPDLSGPAPVILASGEVEIELAPDPFGRFLLVRALIGSLDTDPVRRREQLARLLRAHCAAIAQLRATLAFASTDETAVVALGGIGYGRPVGEVLALIEDVGSLALMHRDRLAPAARGPQFDMAAAGDAVIFQL